jgi:hypothetical protein
MSRDPTRERLAISAEINKCRFPRGTDARSPVSLPEIARSAMEKAGGCFDIHRSSSDERPALRLEGLSTLLKRLLQWCRYGSGKTSRTEAREALMKCL